MRAAALILAVFLLASTTTFEGARAIPVFHHINDYDRDGNVCPLLRKKDVECPVLCVTNHDLCPATLAPTCPSGQSFCLDGTCQESCQGITNACLCNGEAIGAAYTNYVPCMAGQLVNITHFNAEIAAQQTRDTCSSAVGLASSSSAANASSSIGIWGEDTTSAMIWAECPVLPEPTFTFREPMWIAVWSLMGAQAGLLILWHLYKTGREFAFHRSLRQVDGSDAAAGAAAAGTTTSALSSVDEKIKADEKKEQGDLAAAVVKASAADSDTSSIQDSERLRFRGFNTDYIGLFVFGSVVATTLLFLVFLGCIVSDYYGDLGGAEFAIFLQSELSSKIFCAVWHIAAAWFVGVLLFRKRMVNYFRIESYAHASQYVQIERRQEEQVFLDDGNKLIAKLRKYEQFVVKRLNMDILVETHKVKYTSGLRFFEYQCMRYVFNANKHKYEPYEFDLGSTNSKLHEYASGMTTEDAAKRQGLLGSNIIKVHVPSIPIAIAQEFSSYLYLYQMMCMWVWYYFQYFQMGLVQTCIILVSAFVRVILRLRAEYRIKHMAEHVDQVCALRDGEWKEGISSGDLVPGDVFEVRENTQLPCDAVILSGTVVVNESSLTGEAMPIRKIAMNNDESVYDMMGSSKINTLFAGTTVMQATSAGDGDGRIRALALRTGITSEKGMLIHKILFPSPVSFIFNEHIKLAICILLLWGGVAFGLTLWWMGRGDITSWFYGVFIMSQIFSPLLPAAFTINQSVSAARMRSKKILCLDLPRINLSGKVRIFCFDKTGTLTREGLEFYGAVVQPDKLDGTFDDRVEDPLKMDKTLAMGIATCHAVTKVRDQFIGNPVDIESFNAMKWELQTPADSQYLDTLCPPATTPNEKPTPVHVLRRFEFVHARASQSVAVLDPATEHVHVFLKGSFERVKHLSVQDTIPTNYDQTAANYAREGCYVLSLAHRDMGKLGQDVTMEQIKTMSRDDLEKDCHFTGFILFRNMLKHDTTDAITELKEGDTRVVMITGDTALTGIFIARQCGMIEPHQRVLLGDSVAGKLVWHDVDSGHEVDVDQVLEEDPREQQEKQVELAVTGRAFETLIAQNKMRKYLLNTRVFARMTPSDKIQCVRLHMEKGVTGMCGDGGNDCGALRAAHVGLALSEAEASIVSPFSTSNRTVMQCVELLKQGRSALATSFANYKFLIFYGECMAAWELLMFYFTVIAPQPIWITIDGFIVTFMTFAITQARPANKLGPSRPTAKPVGPYTLASALGVIFINFWFVIGGVIYLFQQNWFVCNEFDSSSIDSARWWLLGDNYESEVIALVIIFQFFHNAALVNFGSVYRQSWWRNYVLVVFWCCFFVSTSYMVLADPNPYSCIFRINCGTPAVLNEIGYPMPTWDVSEYNSPLGHNVMPEPFRWGLWGLILGNLAATTVWERVVVQGLMRSWVMRRNKRNPPKNRILFKL
ncbi:hypothetical protein BDB00DRAFT_809960 [Zychaea mexicana]|uniref:uncharacterized protein n=1 Tax=Zychaea mexicana TaxID=64656 RepID=UPI0022FEADF8|nr:uncharacterized protein BDB00DRAFT_809960 [Zychaea mexicana]KAI9496322.1 hypothetical protein BDB00DRAFT_809960 [Zychaea mexicana]